MKDMFDEDEPAEIPTLAWFRRMEVLEVGIKKEIADMKKDVDLQTAKEVIILRTPMAKRAKDAMAQKRKVEEKSAPPKRNKKRQQLPKYNVRQITVEDATKVEKKQFVFINNLFPAVEKAAIMDGTKEVPDFVLAEWKKFVSIVQQWDCMKGNDRNEYKGFWLEFIWEGEKYLVNGEEKLRSMFKLCHGAKIEPTVIVHIGEEVGAAPEQT
jgi:hypothetical protein